MPGTWEPGRFLVKFLKSQLCSHSQSKFSRELTIENIHQCNGQLEGRSLLEIPSGNAENARTCFFAFCAFCVHSRIRFLPKRHRFRCANVCLLNVFAVWFYKCRSRRCAQRRKLGNGHVSTLVASRAPSLSTSSLRTGIAVSRACSLACVRFQLSTPCHTHATPCSTLQCVAV